MEMNKKAASPVAGAAAAGAGGYKLVKDILSAGKKAFTFGWGAANTGYQGLEKLAWYAVPTLSILATLGAIRAMRPEAVAENADKLLLQETLTTSLAKSIRKYDRMNKNRELEKAYGDIRKHDRFL